MDNSTSDTSHVSETPDTAAAVATDTTRTISTSKEEDKSEKSSSSSSSSSSILDSVNTLVSPLSSLFVGNKDVNEEEEKKSEEADLAIRRRLANDMPSKSTNTNGDRSNVKTIPLRQSSNHPQGIKRNEKANAIAAKLAALREKK